MPTLTDEERNILFVALIILALVGVYSQYSRIRPMAKGDLSEDCKEKLLGIERRLVFSLASSGNPNGDSGVLMDAVNATSREIADAGKSTDEECKKALRGLEPKLGMIEVQRLGEFRSPDRKELEGKLEGLLNEVRRLLANK